MPVCPATDRWRSPGLLSGMIDHFTGDMLLHGDHVTHWSPREALRKRGIGRIPEDRHAVGAIGDMSVMENAICGGLSHPALLKVRLARLERGRPPVCTEKAIADYDVKCPSPDARIRLLSGGNMQKLILARALDGDPDLIIAAQPTRGLDVGAVTYVHNRLLDARRRGAADPSHFRGS